MKRGLVFSLCILALAATAHAQTPVVDISLNLRYTDPADPAAGGRWFLMAQAPAGTGGIAGLSAYITNIDTTGIVFGNGSAVGDAAVNSHYPVVTGATLGANVDTVGGTPFNTTFGSTVNVVFGQNNAIGGAIVGNVGASGGPGTLAHDPLHNGIWADSAMLISGTFAGGGNAGNSFNRPAFVANVGPQNNNTDANVYDTTPALGEDAVNADVQLAVRGDSLASLNLEGGGEGLSVGDPNRDFTIDPGDFNIVFNNFFTAQGWDGGDVDGSSDGNVDPADFNAVFNNFFTNQIPPSVVGVPEPASVALAAFGLIATLAIRRRK